MTIPDIYIKDYLVVALGDSYGSGEGAPDIKSQPSGSIFGGYTDPVWEDKRCHRSANSAASENSFQSFV